MRYSHILIASTCVLAAAPIGRAWAQAQTLADYMRISGEIAEARFNCGAEVDMAKLHALGQPHQLQTGDAEGLDRASNMIAQAMAAASDRRKAMGTEQFCAAMMSAYGPEGRAAPGLIKSF